MSMRVAVINAEESGRFNLEQAVKAIHGLELAWSAATGAEGLKRCRGDTPDVVLVDLTGPGLNGPQVVRSIMNDSPCAVLIATRDPEAHPGKVFEAMGHGALDAARIPVLSPSGELLGLVELQDKIWTISKLRGHADTSPQPVHQQGPKARTDVTLPRLLAIGSSTGGPKALASVLSAFPRNFQPAVVVIQHVDKQFSEGLAHWLRQQCRLPVRVARDKEPPAPGQVLIAETDDHLILGPDRRLHYTDEPRKYPYRPSVDIFFKSLVPHPFPASAGVLLTGMGRDGAEGLLELRRAGWFTVAQDQATSTVYGMPKAAKDLDAAQRILPVHEIGAVLARRFAADPERFNPGAKLEKQP
jgi:two-component system response regulator WspF